MRIDSTRRRICLFGAFGVGNLGNECTLQALLYNLRKYMPNAEINCACSGPKEVASNYHFSAFPIRDSPLPPVKNRAVRLLRRIFVGIPLELRRWSRAFRTLKGIDMLIMTGTGMLGDVGISPFGLHYDILKWSIIAKLRRCKLLFVSVGVGPIRKPLSKLFVKAALALADYRSYRDAFSKEYLEGLHFETKGDNVCPDLAFSLPKTMIPSSQCRDGHATVIGVGIITYSQRRANSGNDESAYHNYIKKLGAFVTWLLERRYTVRLLIGDAVYDHRARQDLRSVLEVAEIDYAHAKIIDEPASSVAEVLSQLASTDLVVASRFHNVLLALWLNKPVVAISFHEKVDSLMREVGLSEFCQDIEHIDTNKLIAQFIALQQNAENLKSQIQQNAEAYRVALDEQYEHIFGDI
jgi:polysaccharide pyruvyl transferase WcaK-like protein